MDSLTATVTAKISGTASKTRDLGSISWPISVTKTHSFTTGTAANQVNEEFDDDRTLSASANEALDLSGTLVNAFGDTIAFVGVKALYIENTSTVDTLTVGGAASNAWEPWAGAAGHTFKVPPGGIHLMTCPTAAGWAVTAGTADQLKIANSAGGSTTYRIVILGDLA